MSLPDEFLDAFPGRTPGAPAPKPAAAVVEAPAPVEEEPVAASAVESALQSLVPGPRGPRMGPDATDLPPLDRPDLPDLGPGTPAGEARELRLLQDVQVELAVELGRVKLPLRDLLALGPGAVLELDRAADAPVDVLVNGCLVAKGEVVVIDGEFGVRVTAVVER
ncbi:MAG: fliN [Frankiales bacterium]|nr:fliN [Frankiales bacterium]MCW2779136.1 fliN [Frankiales bacterium]